MYTEALTKAVAVSWTSSSSLSTSMDTFSPRGVLLHESCDDDKVFLSDGEEKHTFEKECEVADALV